MLSLKEIIGEYVYGGPPLTGVLRALPFDFKVTEELAFTPSGEGEHIFCFIEKNNLTTIEVVKRLARVAKVANKKVSFAGLKDKKAITRQWFSIHLPGKEEVDFNAIEDENLKIITVCRHQKKLRRGILKGNHFVITLRDIKGDRQQADVVLKKIAACGFANYFTEQRFGNGLSTWQLAQDYLLHGKKIKSRELKGLCLSAARSFLFNRIVNYRVQKNLWKMFLVGDVMMLAGTQSVFAIEEITKDIKTRFEKGDVTPCAILPGLGDNLTTRNAKQFEEIALEKYGVLIKALMGKGVELNYRPIRVIPKDLSWQWQDDTLTLNFYLPKGSYATALIREIGVY